jgi:uncharacterized protein YwgA
VKQLVILSKVLEALDGDSFTTLEGRIAFQKRVYLAQALGLDLGYRFLWNQYGPYSPELSQDRDALHTGEDEIHRLASELRFKPEAEELLQRIRTLAEAPRDANLSATAWLELLTSLHFLMQNLNLTPDRVSDEDAEGLIDKLLRSKPYFEQGQARLALESLKRGTAQLAVAL